MANRTIADLSTALSNGADVKQRAAFAARWPVTYMTLTDGTLLDNLNLDADTIENALRDHFGIGTVISGQVVSERRQRPLAAVQAVTPDMDDVPDLDLDMTRL